MQLFLATNMHSRDYEGRISLCLCAFVAKTVFAGGKRFASQIFISHQDTKTLRKTHNRLIYLDGNFFYKQTYAAIIPKE